MTRPRVVRAALEQDLLAEHSPGWDYADAFEVVTADDDVPDALRVAHALLAPGAAGRRLLRARDRAVQGLGLHPVTPVEGPLLPVLHSRPGLVVLGLDDRHLDVRVLVTVAPGRVRCTTAVRRHNALGRVYFAVVGPVHRRLVPRLLARTR